MTTPPKEPTIKVVAMPADANADGDIFGGWVLSQMDLAGGVVARKIAKGRVVTVAIDDMTFHLPVLVGDCLECYVDVVKTGTTSITLHVEAHVDRRHSHRREKVTEGKFVFVAVDEMRKPRPLAG